jgi:iron complex transport system substrate-binding protein
MPWTQPVLWRVKRPTATSSFGTQTRLLFSLFFSWCFFGALASWAQPCPGPPFPARLVSLSPLLTENIFVLGAGDRLVGNTVYCQRPTAAQDKEKIGSVQELSIEKIVSLKPDLILASNLTSRQQIDKLRTIGLRVETFGQPASFADICAHFRRLGVMLGLEAQAESIIAQAQAKVEAVRDAVAQLPRRKVFLQVGANPLFSSVNTSFTHDFIELGGGINIAGEQRLGAMKTEQVIALNPEVILIAVMGSEDGIGAEEKNRWLRFPTINAAQNGQVYLLDPDLVCSPSPLTFAETLLTVARLIHPEVANRRPPSLAAP